MKTVVIFLLLVFTSFSQPLKYKENSSIRGCYVVFNGAEIILNDEGYTVALHQEVVSGSTIPGKKLYITSLDGLYMAVATFQFNNDKTDYPVNIDVFDENFNKVSHSFTAPYDLPLPSINISDKGEIILFDPLTYKLEVITTEGKKEYILEKEVDFEMERSFYTAVDGKNFYVLISERGVSPEEAGNNVYLYTTGRDFTENEKKKLAVDIPVGLYLYEGNIIASGADLENGAVLLKSYIVNETIREIPAAFEKLIKTRDGYAAKYGDKLLILNKDFSIAGEKEFDNFIYDIAETEAGIAVLIKNDSWRIYNIGENMAITRDVLLDHSGRGNPPVLGFAEDTLLLHTNDYTYILNEFVRRTK